MGCGSSSDVIQNATLPSENGATLTEKNSKLGYFQKKNTSLTFEVPINDEKSSVKKLPPLRFQRLEEQQLLQPKITLEKLQKRQAEADERRRQILHSRVKSAQQFQNQIHIRSESVLPSENKYYQ